MAESMRQTIISALRDLAPQCPVGRIWGRLADATPEQAQEGNAWAADPEDIADLLLTVITDRMRDEIGVDDCSCGGCDACCQHALIDWLTDP
jgi:hypothetical protein